MCESLYFVTLTGDTKRRYLEKLKIVNNIDPYTLTSKELNLDLGSLANLTLMDLVNYLILSHSYYTGQQLKAYKSLQAYKYYEAGHVLEVLANKANDDAFIILSKVKHSQKTKERPLETWIILLQDGSVSSAHCTCMAGLGEVCTHIATVLFYLHARPSTVDDCQACTSQLAMWPVPPVKSGLMLRVRDMSWSRKPKAAVLSQHVPALNTNEITDMLQKFQVIGVASGICRLIEPFASEIIKNEPENLGGSLDDWYNSEFVSYSYEELLNLAKQKHLVVSDEQIKQIEIITREQSQNNMWFKFRTGRITASIFKSVCKTSIAKPSLTVIKGICYPQQVIFYSKATSYGIKNEKSALQSYTNTVGANHHNFVVSASGFVICHLQPELGASPDGLVSCDCCGLGCIEVKCPYLLHDNVTLEEYAQKKHTCLIVNNGKMELDQTHCYYYQVQLQLFVTNRTYCDFVVWSRNSLYVERVSYNNTFCLENIPKAIDFHNEVVKPELLAKYFTKKVGSVTLWCICNMPDDGRPMLKCDSDDCEIEWFHFRCVNVSEVPLTNWFCQNCK